jgi:putative membrane protein
MNFLAQLIVSALAVIVTSLILPGVHIDSPLTGILVAAVLAVLNAIIKPILVILTIPITIVTLGLFLLIINAGMILLVSHLVPGFQVSGFWTAFFFSIIMSLVMSVFNNLNSPREN